RAHGFEGRVQRDARGFGERPDPPAHLALRVEHLELGHLIGAPDRVHPDAGWFAELGLVNAGTRGNRLRRGGWPADGHAEDLLLGRIVAPAYVGVPAASTPAKSDMGEGTGGR